MQCPSCRAVYSNGLDICPRCKTPASKTVNEEKSESSVKVSEGPKTAVVAATKSMRQSAGEHSGATNSTLIEFPGTARAARPQWRKDLSARVREIQERRAREAEESLQRRIEEPVVEIAETASPQLGLVPTTNNRVVNPIVAAALKRLERAQQSTSGSRGRTPIRGGAAATAVARVAEVQYEAGVRQARTPEATPALSATAKPAKRENVPETKKSESTRAHQLAVVARSASSENRAEAMVDSPSKRMSRELEIKPPPADPARKNAEAVPVGQSYDDRAPVMSRIMGGVIDLLVVGFASSPFAAIIELTNGKWGDWRVIASMGAIVLVVMFLYLTAATALAGRTWGMSVVSLRAVDADTGLPPTTKQSVGRAILYIASLITFGLGLAYALVDAEARTLHDYLSGTAVVRE